MFGVKQMMNERIKELATEVGMSVEYLTNTKQIILIEKFAELIVEECIGIVEYGGEFCSRPKLVEQLKEHFGVGDDKKEKSQTV
jgi:hypothetical protein